MACSSCAARRQQELARRSHISSESTSDSPCEYTPENAESYLTAFNCVNTQNRLAEFGIQKALYNSFLGVLLSIRRHPTAICTFQKELDVMQPYILNIANENVQC